MKEDKVQRSLKKCTHPVLRKGKESGIGMR